MSSLHGIIFAYLAEPKLGELVSRRTSSSLPFCGRYRLIDFSLSSMVNSGIRDVGVIMQRDYQSLLDHLGSGKDWDLSRRSGGLRPLPPFGLPESHLGEYKGTMEAMLAVSSYIEGIRQKYVVLARGDLVANIDIDAVMERHTASGAEITAVCTENSPTGIHNRFIPDGEGFAREILCRQQGPGGGVASLEVYIISKKCLLELISYCSAGNRLHFHRDALMHYLSSGGKVHLHMHKGFAGHIRSVKDYYDMSLKMLRMDMRSELFPTEHPIRTKERADVSTYYGPGARSKNCLVADGCYIEGDIENCVLFRGVRIARGARLRGCVLMQDTKVADGVTMAHVIADKNVSVSRLTTLAGSEAIPFMIPKNSSV